MIDKISTTFCTNCVCVANVTHFSFRFPVYEKTILINFERALKLELGVIFLLRPSIEYGTIEKWLRNCMKHKKISSCLCIKSIFFYQTWDLPVKVEFLRHSVDCKCKLVFVNSILALDCFLQCLSTQRNSNENWRTVHNTKSRKFPTLTFAINKLCGVCCVRLSTREQRTKR